MQVDTTGLKLADSDMLVVLVKSLPEAVKNYVLHHSSADTYMNLTGTLRCGGKSNIDCLVILNPQVVVRK